MNAAELRAAAEYFDSVDGCACDPEVGVTNCIGCDIHGMARHILATVHADDEEPVTVEWFDPLSKTGNLSASPYTRIYEIIPSVRLVAEAKAGGFHPCELWIGGGASFTRRDVTRSQVRRLLSALGIEVKQ